MALNNKLFYQLMRFGTVGILAAIVHFSVVVGIVELDWLKPLLANVLAFMIAFQVSYFGHRYWTFQPTTTPHQTAFSRLLLVSSTGFIANEGLFYIFLNYFQLPYPVALLLVLMILPIATFSVSKFWVFR